MKAAQVSINRQMDKDTVYTYKGILLIPKKDWNFSICNNVDDLEYYASEKNQKEKDYCMTLFICVI